MSVEDLQRKFEGLKKRREQLIQKRAEAQASVHHYKEELASTLAELKEKYNVGSIEEAVLLQQQTEQLLQQQLQDAECKLAEIQGNLNE